MAGTFYPPLPPDLDGIPQVGAKAYFYLASTDTPVIVYQDYDLTSPHAAPVIADGHGIFAPVYLDEADLFFRVRVVDAADALIYDYAKNPIIGPPAPPETVGTINADSVFATGDTKWRYGTGLRAGWLRCNGRTFGSSLSGSDESSADNNENLFLYLWGFASITVVTGKGATAADDWAANKKMNLPDLRGRAPFGLDDMGNAAAARITGGTTLGAAGGTQAETLDVTKIPAHDHGAVTGAAGAHGHAYRSGTGTPSTLSGTEGFARDAGFTTNYAAYTGTPDATNGHQIGGAADHTHTVASQGGGLSHNNLPPYMLGTWYVKK